jgi:hypothetical protein
MIPHTTSLHMTNTQSITHKLPPNFSNNIQKKKTKNKKTTTNTIKPNNTYSTNLLPRQ